MSKPISKYILCTYWWGKNKTTKLLNGKIISYQELAAKLSRKCKMLKIECDILYYHNMENTNYQLNINHKPQFIKDMVKKHNKPILYIDVDILIKKYPVLFDKFVDINVDFSAYNWNSDPRAYNVFDPLTFETFGGIMYFSNSKNSIKLLNLWTKALKNDKYKCSADDRVLAMIFHKNKCINWMKCMWLPTEYVYIPEFFKNSTTMKNAVIVHQTKITTEEEANIKMKAKINRIPSDYKVDTHVSENPNYFIDVTVFKQNNIYTEYKLLLLYLMKYYEKLFNKSKTRTFNVFKKLLKEQGI